MTKQSYTLERFLILVCWMLLFMASAICVGILLDSLVMLRDLGGSK